LRKLRECSISAFGISAFHKVDAGKFPAHTRGMVKKAAEFASLSRAKNNVISLGGRLESRYDSGWVANCCGPVKIKQP
jgi:hypothetical protein